MPVNQSFGCFPSQSAVRSRPKGDLHKLYYKTSSQAEFSWRTQKEEDRAENFDAIHKMGQKNTKYMKYQIKQAPLVDRTACKYTREFGPKPLGDNICNRELADTFRGPQSLPKGRLDVKNLSQYTEDFPNMTTGDLRSAKLPNQGPKRKARTQTLGGIGDSLVLTSSSHDDHRTPYAPLARNPRVAAPKPNITLAGTGFGDAFKTQYSKDFGPGAAGRRILQGSASAPQLDAEELLPAAYSTQVDDDETLFQVRRACFLSPGN
mmetsp:Transcript_35595/g.62894  ORF Transcript_35595/g.62894 Transcript_35595/m.62894 type:complete len:263 (+) Transcript_35595:85-873(+)